MIKLYFRNILLIIVFISFFPLHLFPQDNILIRDTLILDIETTNYYDLVVWANKLGLVSTGNIDDLRKELITHYNLELNINSDEVKSGRTIVVESAREMNYIDNIEIDQNYIILQGEVILEMIDYENNTSHKITADTIIFNQSEKTISASGNIIYEISRTEENEFFYGDSLVFEIETWEGVFFQGVSKTTRLVEDELTSSSEDIDFYFSGENIYRGSEDRIELSHGSITSSRSETPYYRLDAEKIWILAPGEWAIQNAVLYVGRIPVFYFPFFFLPGDEMVFNPALGYKEIEGYFINTTTYLIGVKNESKEDTFSFLKSNNISLKEKTREGLFLRSGDKDLNTDIWPYSNGSNLKLLVDYYTRKGFFLGLDGLFIYDSFIKNINIFTALSISRYLYYDTGLDIYTPFKKDGSGSYISEYEKTYILGLSLPFRFALDFDMAIESNWGKLNIDFPIYSDAKFRSHFLNREEGEKWTELINTDEPTVLDKENDMPALSWYINGNINPTIKYISPFIETMSIDNLSIKLDLLSSTVNDQLPFYYPSSLIFPEISSKITGTLLQTKDLPSDLTEEIKNTDDFNYLADPWAPEESKIKINDIPGLLKSPDILEYIPIELKKSNDFFTNTLKYSIIPSFSINSIFSSEIPDKAESIDFDSDYSIFSAQTTSLLDYSFNIYEDYLDFANKSIFSTNYKEHFDSGVEDSLWDSYILQDKNATNMKLTDNITITSKPFINSTILKESLITYNLNTILYNRYWDPDTGIFLNNNLLWESDTITSHKATIELKIFDSINYQILKLDTVLPPGNVELYPEIIFYAGLFTGSLKTEFHYINDSISNYWLYKPYEGYLKYDFFEKDFFKQTLSVDFQKMENSFTQSELLIDKLDSNIVLTEDLIINLDKTELKKSSTEIQLWFMSFNFLMEDVIGYYFELPSGWNAESESKFQPSKASANINYMYNPDPFWKNRLSFALDIDSSWTMNLQKYTDTAFAFDINLSFIISEFLELNFKSKSVNRATYRYIPGSSEEIELSELNIFSDLLKSFNFFNIDDRRASNFNLELIDITVIHHLHDWDLNLEYSGEPILITEDSNTGYLWTSTFSIFVTWKPVPEINKNINYIENEIIFN